ncbi:Orotate phosphoribosyltransferase [Lysinibacillus sphaericus]
MNYGRHQYDITKRNRTRMLKVGAVELNPTELFTWASGVKSPIYCDTRQTISDPVIRKQLANGLAGIIKENFEGTEIVAGTATAITHNIRIQSC